MRHGDDELRDFVAIGSADLSAEDSSTKHHIALHHTASLCNTTVACRKCETGSRASLLLTIFVVLFVLVLAALFAREWTLPGDEGDQGSGYMTKAKIVITHVQVGPSRFQSHRS